VLKEVHKNVYLIDISKKGRLHPMFHISVLKKFTLDEKGFHPKQLIRLKPSYDVWDKLVVLDSTDEHNLLATKGIHSTEWGKKGGLSLICV